MMVEELCRRYEIDPEEIRRWIKLGVFPLRKKNGEIRVPEEAIGGSVLGLISCLCRMHLEADQIRRFFAFYHNEEEEARERIKILKTHRHALLEEIHQKQQFLD